MKYTLYISFEMNGSLDFVFWFVETLFRLHIKWWPCIVHHTLNGLYDFDFEKMIAIFSAFVPSSSLSFFQMNYNSSPFAHSFVVFRFVLWVKSRYITFRTYSAILSVGSVNFIFFFSFYFVWISFYSAFCTSVSIRLILFRLLLAEYIRFDSF